MGCAPDAGVADAVWVAVTATVLASSSASTTTIGASLGMKRSCSSFDSSRLEYRAAIKVRSRSAPMSPADW